MARRVLCLGDSLTEGYVSRNGFPAFPMSPYSDVLQGLLGEEFHVDNAGVSGETVQEIRERYCKYYAAKPYEYIFILGGTNNLSDTSDEEITKELITLHQQALATKAITFVLPMPEMRFGPELFEEETRQAVNTALELFAEKHSNCFYLDWASRIPNPGQSSPYFSDNIHLSKEGYQRMGTIIHELFLSSLCKK